jgi:competence protein ComEA
VSKKHVDLNTADEKALEQIQGVGPELAVKILIHRKQFGPFKDWEDVKTIPGVPPSTIDTLKHHGVTIGRKVA